jgi:hypothetical protein
MESVLGLNIPINKSLALHERLEKSFKFQVCSTSEKKLQRVNVNIYGSSVI